MFARDPGPSRPTKKRSAPKAAPKAAPRTMQRIERPAPKPTPVRPPKGDVASSGGDYGKKRSDRGGRSKKVQKTYAASYNDLAKPDVPLFHAGGSTKEWDDRNRAANALDTMIGPYAKAVYGDRAQAGRDRMNRGAYGTEHMSWLYDTDKLLRALAKSLKAGK